mmetsp:Transcript_4615/g.20702  ORF Transcript_4615/g.20702 Transcript_4615/m.20702 type:complete len:482 (+) Transcript_4615:235-1680(+)
MLIATLMTLAAFSRSLRTLTSSAIVASSSSRTFSRHAFPSSSSKRLFRVGSGLESAVFAALGGISTVYWTCAADRRGVAAACSLPASPWTSMARDAVARALDAAAASANPRRCASHARSDARSLAKVPTFFPNPGKEPPPPEPPPPALNVDDGYQGAVTGCVGCAPPHRPCLGTLGTPPSIICDRDPAPADLCFGPPVRVASWSRLGAKDSTHGRREPFGNISRARSVPAMRARNACKSSSQSTAPYRLRYQTHSSNARSTAARSQSTSRSCSATKISRSALAASTARLANVASNALASSSNVAIARSLPSIAASFSRSSSSINRSFSTTLSSFRSARLSATLVRSTCSPMIAPAVASSVRSRSFNSAALASTAAASRSVRARLAPRTDVLHLPNTAATRKIFLALSSPSRLTRSRATSHVTWNLHHARHAGARRRTRAYAFNAPSTTFSWCWDRARLVKWRTRRARARHAANRDLSIRRR